ncbi:RNA polymerase sigma factor, sigma-70 family [Acetivibrio clariflavus DSM 19732]|uniref:RNA polymerase sigma factor, sigma-70 family n=2 Tax=Acetivibrio clariflavus TaxID=288965 RepID=G8LXQ9_ACECE|nr:RNA polymerase sigma factor, sigma-70 family [Acetivibrio clariflavus DSM 19732]
MSIYKDRPAEVWQAYFYAFLLPWVSVFFYRKHRKGVDFRLRKFSLNFKINKKLELNLLIKYLINERGEEMEINQLVQASKKGDMQSFIQLLRLKEELIYNIAKAYTQNSHDAEDCISESTIRAYDKLKQLKDPEKFYTWYISILVNTCRKKYKTLNREVEYIPEQHDFATEEIMKSTDNRILVEGILEHLKENEREIIVLRYLRDFSLEEIAEILTIPVGTVKSRISRIIGKIKIKYGRCSHEI